MKTENDKMSLGISFSNLSVMAEKAAKDGNVKLCVDYFNDHLIFLDKIIDMINDRPLRYQYLFKGGDENEANHPSSSKIYYSENSLIGLYITSFRASLNGNLEISIYAASALNRFLRLLLTKFSKMDSNETMDSSFQFHEYQQLTIQTLQSFYSLNAEVNRKKLEIVSLQSYITDGWYYMLFDFPYLSDNIENHFSYYLIQNIQENIKNDSIKHFRDFLDLMVTGSFRYSVGSARRFEIRNILQEVFPNPHNVISVFESSTKIVSRRTYLVWQSEFDEIIYSVVQNDNKRQRSAVAQAKRYALNEQRIGILRLIIIHIGAYCLKEEKYEFLNAMLNNFSPKTNLSYSGNKDILPSGFDLGIYIINMFDVVSFDEFGWGRMDKDVFIYRFLICLLFKEKELKFIFNINDLKTDELNNLIYRLEEFELYLPSESFSWWNEKIDILNKVVEFREQFSSLISELRNEQRSRLTLGIVDGQRWQTFVDQTKHRFRQDFNVVNIFRHINPEIVRSTKFEDVTKNNERQVLLIEHFSKEEFLSDSERRSNYLSNIGMLASSVSNNLSARVNSRFIRAIWNEENRYSLLGRNLNVTIDNEILRGKVLISSNLHFGYDLFKYDDKSIEWNHSKEDRFYVGYHKDLDTSLYTLGNIMSNRFLICLPKDCINKIEITEINMTFIDRSEEFEEQMVESINKLNLNYDFNEHEIIVFTIND